MELRPVIEKERGKVLYFLVKLEEKRGHDQNQPLIYLKTLQIVQFGLHAVGVISLHPSTDVACVYSLRKKMHYQGNQNLSS